MTYAEFRKEHPATRCWQKFDANIRSDRASSHRLGRRQREATGEFFYVHPMVPNRAFSTAKSATAAAFRAYEAGDAGKTRITVEGLRVEALAARVDDGAVAAEEAAEVEAVVREGRST